MGRYYFGTISGKFWFAIQSSLDANNFKDSTFVEPDEYSDALHYYYQCGCEVENIKKEYCHNCYSDYNEHYESIDECDISCIDDKLLAYRSNHIKYEFDSSELEYIKSVLETLENKIGKNNIMHLNFTISGEESDFEYDLDNDIINVLSDSMNELIARWCFGKQIVAALEQLDYCTIYCEL